MKWIRNPGFRVIVAMALAAGLMFVGAGHSTAGPGTTTRVSVAGDGTEANGVNFAEDISADGRVVAFWTFASNLAPGDSFFGETRVFVHDRDSGSTEKVSVDSSENEANGGSDLAGLSADGRYVVFRSSASNLIDGDTNGTQDVFVRDRELGTTERVSVDSLGNEAEQGGGNPSISDDGRYVAFISSSGDLAPNDLTIWQDAFVHDRVTGTTELVSLNDSGEQADNHSQSAAISGDGRYVSFSSQATNLVSGAGGLPDVFVRDQRHRVPFQFEQHGTLRCVRLAGDESGGG